jgi:hypothetical protein
VFRKGRGRLTPREEREKTLASHKYIAMMIQDPAKRAEYERKFCQALPPKRHRVRRPVDGKPAAPYERDVLAQIIKVLRLDPRVSRVERNQSGVFQDGNRYIRVGVRGKLDLTVYLKSGRFAEIEVKRDFKTKPDAHQLERIAQIKREGGISGWAWSPESALAILP